MENTLFKFVNRFLFLTILTFFLFLVVGIVLVNTFDMDIAVEGQGALRPRELIPVKSPITGLIAAIEVHDGQQVVAGDTLFVLDVREAAKQLSTTLTDISIKELDIERTRQLMNRTRNEIKRESMLREAELEYSQLVEEQQRLEWEIGEGAELKDTSPIPFNLQLARAQTRVSRIQLDQACERENELEALSVQIAQNELELAKLRDTAAYLQRRTNESVVLAPATGCIVAQELTLKMGDLVQEGAVVLELAQPDEWIMRAFTSDKVIPYIRQGQEVKVYLDAFPYLSYRVFTGQVTSYSLKPTAVGERNLYLVDVDMSDRELFFESMPDLNLNGLKGRVKFVIYRQSVAGWMWDYLRERAGKMRISAPG